MKKAKEGAFTTEELLHELASAKSPAGSGNTVEELALKLGWSESRVAKLLNVAKAQGRLAVEHRTSEGLDGRLFRQRLYRVLAKARA